MKKLLLILFLLTFFAPKAEAARLWSSGFELNSGGSGIEWTTITNGTIQPTTVRSGAYVGRITGILSDTARGFLQQHASAAGSGPYFVRFYFRYSTLPSAANTIFSFDDDTTVGEASAVAMKFTSAAKMQLFNGATQIGSDSSALTANTWYRVEIEYDGSPAGGSEVLKARVDGSEFAASSALTLAATTHSISFGANLRAESQNTGTWFFDDIAINDSTGSAQTSYPGSGKIVHMKPNAAGDNAMGAAGGADSGAAWSQVSEVAPDDATAYYVLDADSDILDVNIESSATAGIGSTDAVTLVQVGTRFRTADAASAAAAAARIKSQASGTVVSTSGTAQTTTWVTNDNAAPRNYLTTAYVDPQAGGAWTPALLDTAQIGVIATDAAPDYWVSTLWALVEYVPSLTMNALVIGGGGGGGIGGGGGAGGYREETVSVGGGVAYTVTIGAGGGHETNGATTTLGTLITSLGGGRGGSVNQAGTAGGSGGGGGSSSGLTAGGLSLEGQGKSGGTNAERNTPFPGGGGGGAGAAGSSPPTALLGGDGGAGTASSITGSSVTRAGGGGGGILNAGGTAGGAGGTGGGGAGGNNANGTSGTANTGGGGGGAGNGKTGGTGGSGVVIISYVTADFGDCTGGDETTDGANTVHTFTSSGTFTVVLAAGGEPAPSSVTQFLIHLSDE